MKIINLSTTACPKQTLVFGGPGLKYHELRIKMGNLNPRLVTKYTSRIKIKKNLKP